MDNVMLQWGVQVLLAALGAVLWASHQNVQKKADQVSSDLAEYKIFVAEKYSTTEELRDALNSINRHLEAFSTKLDVRLDRLELKLDRKQDKSDYN